MYKLFPSSPEALQLSKKNQKAKYPWTTISVGESFIVPHGTVKMLSMVTHACRMSKRLGKKFKVVDHDKNGIEVACVGISKPAEQTKQQPLGWDKMKEGS